MVETPPPDDDIASRLRAQTAQQTAERDAEVAARAVRAPRFFVVAALIALPTLVYGAAYAMTRWSADHTPPRWLPDGIRTHLENATNHEQLLPLAIIVLGLGAANLLVIKGLVDRHPRI